MEIAQKVDTLEQLWIVPHPALLGYITPMEVLSEKEAARKREDLVSTIWPSLKSGMSVELDDCFRDVRLHEVYSQALRAHEAGLYEAAVITAVIAIERVLFLARGLKVPQRNDKWLREKGGSLEGGYASYKTWRVLFEKVLAGCWGDQDADDLAYPNRHAVAHGMGTILAGRADSLNAILLAHFAIKIAQEVRN